MAPKRLIHEIEECLAQIKSELEPLESGQMHIAKKRGSGPWIDQTTAMIDSHKRNIAVYEAILARLHRRDGV
jgi:hypothetical protein